MKRESDAISQQVQMRYSRDNGKKPGSVEHFSRKLSLCGVTANNYNRQQTITRIELLKTTC